MIRFIFASHSTLKYTCGCCPRWRRIDQLHRQMHVFTLANDACSESSSFLLHNQISHVRCLKMTRVASTEITTCVDRFTDDSGHIWGELRVVRSSIILLTAAHIHLTGRHFCCSLSCGNIGRYVGLLHFPLIIASWGLDGAYLGAVGACRPNLDRDRE